VYFSNIALRFLLRRKLRTILTIIGFGISIMSFTTFIGLSVGFEKTWSEVYSAQGAPDHRHQEDSRHY